MANDSVSRDIPEPIQREVRQRCGFGCVICGLPLYEYEHLLGFADVQRHRADEITLLCHTHHGEKTRGLLPVEQVIEADKNPYNRRAGVSKPYDLHYTGTECEMVIASNSFKMHDPSQGAFVAPLLVDDVAPLVFVLENGHLLLNATIFDEYNNVVLSIQRNVLICTPDTWDITLIGRNLILREAYRKILMDIVFDVPNRILIKRGRFLCNGVEFLVTPDFALVTNNNLLFSGNKMTGVAFGLAIGTHVAVGAGMRFAQIPRYLGDSSASQRWAREACTEHTAQPQNSTEPPASVMQ